jgi:tetratricopeptide (TPR) repeat protein
MKVRSLFPGLLVTALLCLPALFSFSRLRAAETGEEVVATTPTAIAAASTNLAAVSTNTAELEEMRAKLDAVQHANDLALGRWSALIDQNNSLIDQNNSLSNVLVGLQQTLTSQRRREVELTEEARSFNNRVMMGAGAAMFLVFLASYWFQLRCLNRVMEITTAPRELPAPYAPALLEAANARESHLLEAVKLLENRIRQLEMPTAIPAAAASGSSAAIPANAASSFTNGTSTENGHAAASAVKVIEAAPAEAQPASSKAAVLLAKGEILLDMERLQEAVNVFTEALTLDASNAEAYLKKGIALERMNRLELALRCYDEAVRLNPKRSFAYVHKARVLAALHRYDEALSVYDLALGKNSVKGGAGTATGELQRASAEL